MNVVDQSGWKQYREDFSWQKDGTDSDDELFADYDAALEAEQMQMEVEKERDDAESIQRAAERQELERQERQARLERCARFRMTGFVPRFCTPTDLSNGAGWGAGSSGLWISNGKPWRSGRRRCRRAMRTAHRRSQPRPRLLKQRQRRAPRPGIGPALRRGRRIRGARTAKSSRRTTACPPAKASGSGGAPAAHRRVRPLPRACGGQIASGSFGCVRADGRNGVCSKDLQRIMLNQAREGALGEEAEEAADGDGAEPMQLGAGGLPRRPAGGWPSSVLQQAEQQASARSGDDPDEPLRLRGKGPESPPPKVMSMADYVSAAPAPAPPAAAASGEPPMGGAPAAAASVPAAAGRILSEEELEEWKKLVLRCATALGRSDRNLPVYTSEASVALQVRALGTETVLKIMALSRKEQQGVLDRAEKNYIIQAVSRAVKSEVLELSGRSNGAKAGLAALKHVAGAGVPNPVRHPASGGHTSDVRPVEIRRALPVDTSAPDNFSRTAEGYVIGTSAATPGAAARMAAAPDGGRGIDGGKAILARVAHQQPEAEWIWYASQSQAARALDMDAGPISKVCNGAQRTAFGYEFKFAAASHQPKYERVRLDRAPPSLAQNLPPAPDLKSPEGIVDVTMAEAESNEEQWHIYSDRTSVASLLNYLDVRGFRECPLHHRLYEVSKRIQIGSAAELDRLYRTRASEMGAAALLDTGSEDLNAAGVLEAIVSTLCEHDEITALRQQGMTGASKDGKPVLKFSEPTTIEDWGSGPNLGRIAAAATVKDNLAIDTLDGRAVWAKWQREWWPARVFPLRMATKEVLQARDSKPGASRIMAGRVRSHKRGGNRGAGQGRARGRGQRPARGRGSRGGKGRMTAAERAAAAAAEREADEQAAAEAGWVEEQTIEELAAAGGDKVLVKFYDTDQFHWVDPDKTKNFWSSYRKILETGGDRQNDRKSFQRALRSARIARYEEQRPSEGFRDTGQILETKMERLVDIMEDIADSLAWDSLPTDTGIQRDTWENSLAKIWGDYKESRGGRGARTSARANDAIQDTLRDKVMLPCLQLLQSLMDASEPRSTDNASTVPLHYAWWADCVFRPQPIPVSQLDDDGRPMPQSPVKEGYQKHKVHRPLDWQIENGIGPVRSYAYLTHPHHQPLTAEQLQASVMDPSMLGKDATGAVVSKAASWKEPTVCQACFKQTDGEYGSGKFCSQECQGRYGAALRHGSKEQVARKFAEAAAARGQQAAIEAVAAMSEGEKVAEKQPEASVNDTAPAQSSDDAAAGEDGLQPATLLTRKEEMMSMTGTLSYDDEMVVRHTRLAITSFVGNTDTRPCAQLIQKRCSVDVNALTRGVDICPYCIRGAGKLWGHQGKHLRKLKEDKKAKKDKVQEEQPEQEQPEQDAAKKSPPKAADDSEPAEEAVCEQCGEKHLGDYGSGRFCSRQCAARFSTAR